MQSTRSRRKEKNIISGLFDAAFFFERGLRSYDRHDLSKALKYFSRCHELEPHNVQYMYHLALTYTDCGHFEESNRILVRLLQQHNQPPVDCFYQLANNHAHLGELEQAEQYALQYLQGAPQGEFREDMEDLLFFVSEELERAPLIGEDDQELIMRHEHARFTLEQGKFVEAARILEALVEEYPEFLAARNNLALAYYYLGQPDAAMGTLEDVLDRDPCNLHAICNIAVFHYHQGNTPYVQTLIDGLKKVRPFHVDQHIKLATTLGILGEDECAYVLFQTLVRKGWTEDISCYHYVAVAAFNTKRWDEARNWWQRLKQLDEDSEIAAYYLQTLEYARDVAHTKRLSYHYQLPYDVQLKKKDDVATGNVTEEIVNDPLIRSSLFWLLRHGDQDTKLQVIQTLEYFADQEVEDSLRHVILDAEEEDYVKKVAVFVLRKIGAPSPYRAILNGKTVEIDEDLVDEQFPVWMAQWQKVMRCLQLNMDGEYDLMEHQYAQKIWSKYLRIHYPNLPRIRKAEAWAAAIEYIISTKKGRTVTKTEIARRYNIAVNTLSRNVRYIEEIVGDMETPSCCDSLFSPDCPEE